MKNRPKATRDQTAAKARWAPLRANEKAIPAGVGYLGNLGLNRDATSLDIDSCPVKRSRLRLGCPPSGPARNHFQRGGCACKSISALAAPHSDHHSRGRCNPSSANVTALLRRLRCPQFGTGTGARAKSAASKFSPGSSLHLPNLNLF